MLQAPTMLSLISGSESKAQKENPSPPADLQKLLQRGRYRSSLYNLPNERQQDYSIDGQQAFLRPYADDLLKLLLTSPLECSSSKSRADKRQARQPKVLLAADMPRLALVHLIGQMASHKKLSFLSQN